MSDFVGLLDSAVYKLLITRVVPGLICISPYIALLFQHSTPLRANWANFRTEGVLITLFAAATAGMLLENFGTSLENGHFRRLKDHYSRETPPRDITQEWYQYLRMESSTAIGHGYLRQMLLFLHFELHTAMALLLATPGLFLLAVDCRLVTALVLAFVVIACALWRDVPKTVDHLVHLRFELLKTRKG
jgi:hypothetical protein